MSWEFAMYLGLVTGAALSVGGFLAALVMWAAKAAWRKVFR